MEKNESAWLDSNSQTKTPEKRSLSNVDKSEPISIIEDLKATAKKKQFCYKYFKDFTNSTSLHGFGYLGQDRPIVEKIWWVVVIVLSTVVCSHLIVKIWIKWDESPVIVSFAETSIPTWQIPFPAVTVCSETKSRQTVFNYTDIYSKQKANNITDEELKKLHDISLMCDSFLMAQGPKTVNVSSVKFLHEVAPPFNEMMMTCKFLTKIFPCWKVFKTTITDDGFCYTFNMLSGEEMFNMDALHKDYPYVVNNRSSQGWKLDGGYPSHLPMDTYPVRGRGAGTTAGLTVILRAYNSDLDYICRGPVQGFTILLHSPVELPRISTQYFRAPLSQEVIAAVKPSMMTTSEGLRNYDPHRRQCFFESERTLKYFKVYTQNNCEIECLTNYTMLLCGCVKFNMPRDPTMPICGSGSTMCVNNATNDLLTRGIRKDLSDSSTTKKKPKPWYQPTSEDVMDEVAGRCDCLPACTSISYDVQISQADYDWKNVYKSFGESVNATELNLARVVVVFKEPLFIPSRRSELYGSTDFLANCGGLLGLCLGFSVLSLFEIVYFLTLRACCNVKRRYSKWRQYNSNIDGHTVKE